MNFESIGYFALMNSTPLASVVVSLAGLAVLLVPVFAIVGLPATAPAWALFARDVFRLPLAHAMTAAKVVSVHLGIPTAKLLTAPFTVEQLTTPAKQNLATFKRASKLFSWLHPVGFDNELLSAHWTSPLTRDCVGFAVGLLAVIRAISAKSSALGFGLIAVSEKNIGPRLVIIRFVVAIFETP